jgi:hypothetical protein
VLRIRSNPAKVGTDRKASGADEIRLNPANIGTPRIIKIRELKIMMTIIFSKKTMRMGIGSTSKYSIRSLLPTVFALIMIEPTNVNTKMALNSVAPKPGFSKMIAEIGSQINEKMKKTRDMISATPIITANTGNNRLIVLFFSVRFPVAPDIRNVCLKSC